MRAHFRPSDLIPAELNVEAVHHSADMIVVAACGQSRGCMCSRVTGARVEGKAAIGSTAFATALKLLFFHSATLLWKSLRRCCIGAVGYPQALRTQEIGTVRVWWNW